MGADGAEQRNLCPAGAVQGSGWNRHQVSTRLSDPIRDESIAQASGQITQLLLLTFSDRSTLRREIRQVQQLIDPVWARRSAR